MRRKKKRRYSLETIVLSLIFVPPLGFFLLWTKARSRRGKLIVATAFLLFLALATGAFFRFEVSSRLKGPGIPPEGYDISHDDRGRYVNPEIQPLEWTIFAEVVREIRHLKQSDTSSADNEIMSIDTLRPDYKAFEKVADRHDMSYEDVKGIYLKVTTQLATKLKGKK